MELTKFINDNIIGRHHQFDGPFGRKHVIYCDFTASGKALHFIEHFIINQVLPTYGNTHTSTGMNSVQTTSYRDEAREILRNSFGATKDDAVIFVGSGCTGAIHKLVDGLGLSKNDRPVVFVGASEHHSNLLPWREIASRVVRIKDDENGLLDTNELENALKIAQRERRTLIGCFSAASNITGTLFQDMKITALLHKYGAYSFWDYATAAPYVKIAMNPTSREYPNGEAHKDAIYFSMHKFVGGPQTPGLLIVKKSVIERNPVPGGSGGGTVLFVDRNSHHYLSDVETREEGGTPAIVESIRAGLVIKLKDTVTDEWIMKHENKLTRLAFTEWQDIPELILLGSKTAPRVAIFSFLIRHLRTGIFLHHNFVCALLNDIYGIQARG
jgi:selenocysteine lyase/cysteine desulfurase